MSASAFSSITELPLRRWGLDLAAVLVLLAASAIGFWPTFAGGSFLGAAIGGALLGVVIAAVAAWQRWGILIIAGLTVAAYFVFGGALALPHTAIAGFIPSLDTLQQLALGVVTSWKQMLTTVAPVSGSDGHFLVPFLLFLVIGVVTASLALRLTQPAWALLPSGALLAAVIALGTPEPAMPLIQGAIFAVAGIAWLAVRQIWAPQNAAVSVSEIDPARANHMRMRRLIAGGAVLAVATGAGVAASAVTPQTEVRHVLRDTIIPPFDVRDYPSALQSFRGYVRDDEDTTLFTVRGLPEGARVRLAAMDEFDGQVINVVDGGPGTSSAFTPIRANMSPDAEGMPVTLEFDIGDYSDVWVPQAGLVSEIRFSGDDAEQGRQLHRADHRAGRGDRQAARRCRVRQRAHAEEREGARGAVDARRRDHRRRGDACGAGAGARRPPLGGGLLQSRARGRGHLARRAHLRAHLDSDRRRPDGRRRRAVRRRDDAPGRRAGHPCARRHGLLPG
jgi:hypothetical protein